MASTLVSRLGVARPSRFFVDLLTTSATTAATVLVGLVTIRLLANGLGPEGFGAYSLSRRALAIASPILMLGIGLALPRYLAVASEEGAQDRLYLSAVLYGIAPSVVFALLAALAAPWLSGLIFHDSRYTALTKATLFMIAAYAVFSVLYAYYRGTSRMNHANAWQIVASAAGPLVAAILLARRGDPALVVAGFAAVMAVAALPVAARAWAALARGSRPHLTSEPGLTLLRYGTPRVTGSFALAALFGIGPFLAPYFGSLAQAGYLAAAQSVLGVLEGALAAFGIVALPKVARMMQDGRSGEVRSALREVMVLVVHLGLFAALHAAIWAGVIVALLLGPEYQDAVPLMRIVLLGLVPYFAYVMLRSIVDAVEERAVNTRNLLVALVVTGVAGALLASAGLGAVGLATGMTLGFAILGFTTYRFLRARFALEFDGLQLAPVLAANVAIAGATWLAGRALVGEAMTPAQFAVVALIELVAAGLYLLVLVRLRVSWIAAVRARLWPGGQS